MEGFIIHVKWLKNQELFKKKRLSNLCEITQLFESYLTLQTKF